LASEGHDLHHHIYRHHFPLPSLRVLPAPIDTPEPRKQPTNEVKRRRAKQQPTTTNNDSFLLRFILELFFLFLFFFWLFFSLADQLTVKGGIAGRLQVF
jgi:hypothetical protein